MYQKIRRAFVASALALFCFAAYAQQTVKGTVKDANGEPMIGVTIATGSGAGAVTDLDGNFTIQNASPSTVLNISYVGYKSQQVKVGSQSNFNIVLQEDNTNLDEVVVIGYGTVKKRDLTGSVSSVGGDALKANPVANVAEALQGKLAGVQVISQDGRPGATMSIKVRGGGSISQSNEPLYVVDGFPVSGIDDIPADQIVSIDVLKDASSTAIYGARGGNGVILVTTKAAETGKTTVTYDGYYQAKWAAKKFDVLDAQDYVKFVWSYATAGNWNVDGIQKYFGLGSAYGNHFADYASMSSHDYTDDMLRTASGWNHNISIQGGTEKTKYTFSANYLTDQGIKINSDFSRLSLNFKFRQELAKNLNFDMDIRYSIISVLGRDYASSTQGSLLSSAFQYRPIDTPHGEDVPSLFGMGEPYIAPEQNPVLITNAIWQKNNGNRLRGNFALSWQPIAGLTLRTEFGAGQNYRLNRYYDDGSVTSNFTAGAKYATLARSNGTNWRSVSTINYEVQGLGENHSLNFLLGNEELYSKSESTNLYGKGYPMDDVWTRDRVFGLMQNGDAAKYAGDNRYVNSYTTPETTQSWFGRVNYTLLGRYLFTATMRADGSSKFGPNNRWGYFPAAAVAWRISDEPFLSSASRWLDNLKLRVSYGTAGNDNIDSSLWRETWTSGSTVINGEAKQTYAPSGLKENPDLKWETNVSRNIGLDFGFFNRLNGTLDFYWNSTKDLLMNAEIDASTGYKNQYQNVGQTSNKGIELALNASLVRSKDFNLNMNLTYNLNYNKVDKLSEAFGDEIRYGTNWGSSALMPGDDYIIKVGEPVGLVRGYTSDGYYSINDFDYVNGKYVLKAGVPDITDPGIYVAYPIGNEWKAALPEGQNAFPGCVKLKDVNEDGNVDTGDISVIGKIQPHHTGGFAFTGNYKNFDFNANFAYQLDGKVYNAQAMVQYNGGKETGLGKNKIGFIKDAFKIYDVNSSGELYAVTNPNELAALNADAKYPLPYYESSIVLSEYVESAAYLRLSSLTLGYTLPKSITNKIFIQSARFYVTGGNLFCLSGYSGLDPDVNADPKKGSNQKYPTIGLDYGSYHRARTFTVGINVKF